MAENNPELVLSICKRFIPNRKLLGSDENGLPIALDPDNLQEEVYSWKILEPPFDCISDDDVRRKLQEILVHRLCTPHPPGTRSIEALREFVSVAETAMDDGRAEWISTHSSSADDEVEADKVNPLLALTLHLKWLLDCFADRPGISVAVR